jgi:altronate dehydratase
MRIRWSGGRKQATAGGQDLTDGNPAPGNRAGGIMTLEKESLGSIYKAGTSTTEDLDS